MKFVTVLVNFLRDVFDLLSSRNFETMATWRNDFSLLELDLQRRLICARLRIYLSLR